jgi:hypothetical protein
MRSRRSANPLFPILLGLSSTLLVLSCSDGGGGVTDPGPGQQGAISIVLAQGSITVTPGQDNTVGITVTRTGGFAGAVQLALEGAPAGITGSFDPPSVPGGATASTLTLTASTAAEPGTYQVTVRASGQGVAAQTAALGLTVAPTPAYTLAADPASLNLVRGETGTAEIRVARTNFTSAVALSVSGVPGGASASLSPSSVTGDAATLTVDVGAGAALGDYTLVVTGQTQGLEDRTVELSLQVLAGPTGPGVTFSFCPSFAPGWLAYQDRDGPWTQVATSPGTAVTMPIEGRGAVAWSFEMAGPTAFRVLHLIYATADELNLVGEDWCGRFQGGKRVSGTMAGLGGDDAAMVTLGNSSIHVPGTDPDFTLLTVPDGPRDLIAARNRPASGPSYATDRVILRRGLDPADGASLPAIDFDAAEAFEPVTRQVSIGNLAGEAASPTVSYATANRAHGALYIPAPAPAGIQEFPAVPAARQEQGDLHVLLVGTEGVEVGDQVRSRMATTVFRVASDQSVVLGPAPAAAAVTTVGTAPYLRLRVQATRQQVYGDHIHFGYGTTSGAVSLSATVAYFGATPPTTWDFSLPDLAPAGYDPSWGPFPGGFLTLWHLFTSGWEGQPGALAWPVDGLRSLIGVVAGALP